MNTNLLYFRSSFVKMREIKWTANVRVRENAKFFGREIKGVYICVLTTVTEV